jgi:hypothetical protein
MSRSPSSVGNDAQIERVAELHQLQDRIRQRKSMLLFGEQGVGKTRLLQQIVGDNRDALYVSRGHAPREFLTDLVESQDRARGSKAKRSRSLQSMSVISLRGTAESALEDGKKFLVIDHVQSPSPALSSMIKEMNYYGRTPIIFAARSPHMEDIGLLRSLCTDKSERLELKNWPESVAMEFANRCVANTQLSADNMQSFLHELVEMSRGNPGAILQMVEMARLPQYRVGDQIKVHVLYLDYRMKGAPEKLKIKMSG